MALRDDQVGITLRCLDELEMHRPHRCKILTEDTFNGPSSLGDVTLYSPRQTQIGIGVDKYLEVELTPEVGLGENQDPLDNNDGCWLDTNRLP